MTCKYSDKYAVLIELYNQEVKSLMDGTNELSVIEDKMTEIETVLKELFDDGEEIFKRFIREGNPIVIGGKIYADPEKERGYIKEDVEPSIDTMRVEFGNESEYSISISNFRQNIMKKCLIGFEENYKISLPNITGSEVNNRITEVKMDLIRAVFTPDDIQQLIDTNVLTDYSVSDYIDQSVIPSDEVLSLLMRKAAGVTGSMSVTKKRAVLTLKYFDDFIKDQCPFITISDRYKNHNFEGHSEKYQLKDASAHAGSGWQDKDQQAIDQVSDIATLILDFMPVLKDGSMTTNTVGKAQFLSVISTIRDWVMDGNPGHPVSLMQYWKKGGRDWYKEGTANIKKIFNAYIEAYTKSNSTLNAKYKFADIDVVQTIAEYLYKANESDYFNNENYQKLQKVFGKMFYNVAFLHQVGYITDSSKVLKAKELKANISDNAFRDEENVLRSRIYVERVSKHPIDQNSFTYEGFKFEKSGKNYKVKRGETTYQIGSTTAPDYEFAAAFMEQVVGVDTQDLRDYFGDDHNAFCTAAKDYIDLVTKYGIYREPLDTNLFVVDSKLSPDYIKSFKMKTKYKGVRAIADAYTNIKGENSKSYVKSIDNKNNLSAYGMMNLAHRLPEIDYDMKNSNSVATQNEKLKQSLDETAEGCKYQNPYKSNKLFTKDENHLYSSVKIRSEISVNGNTVSPTGLSTGELFKVAFQNDFLDCLNNSDVIRLQPITYADKSTQFLFEFNTKAKVGDTNKTIKDCLKEVCEGKNSKGILNFAYDERSNRIQAIFNNVVLDYARAFSDDAEFSAKCIAIAKEGNDPERIKHFYTLLEEKRGDEKDYKTFFKEIKKAFADKNVNFSTEVHYTKKGFNGTFYHQCKIFNGNGRKKDLYKAYLNTQRKRFIIDLIKENVKLDGITITANGGSKNIYDTIDKSKLEDIMSDEYNVSLSGNLEAYFEANLLYGGELTSMLVGEIFVHPSKEKNVEIDNVVLELRDNSSRLIAHSKRSVIPGATMHVPVQGLPNGIAPRINVAVMEDVISLIETIDGNVTEQESMNGAGLSFRPHGKLVQNSLVDVKCGVDRKTIGHDIDPLYGKAVLLKWAEFDITNDRRRIARASNVRLESIYKKMGSHKTFLEVDANLTPEAVMDSLLNLYDNDNPIFYQDPMTLHNYKIVKGGEGFYKQRVTANGQPEEDAELVPIDKTITTIYDIDQLFGGAYAMEMSPEGTLKWSEGNIDMIVNFLSKHEAAKDCYIAYAVNQSGIKVGESNVNSSNNWFNNKPLSTFSMSTEYYGLQLNAEHDVTEGGEVSEMTQMMSGLMQNGYTKDMLLEIYKDIGACAATALSKLTNALNNYTGEDNDSLHKILGRILAQSLESKTTIGLSQAFVALANKAFLEEGIDVKIPYSAVTVNNNLITAIASEINRRGIKRKWAGMAGQQAPSYNMMMHYTINGKTTNYENYARECMNALRDPAHGGLTDAQFERGFRFGRGTVSTIYVPQLAGVKNIEQLNEEIFSKYDVRVVIEPQDGVPSVALGEGISGTTYTIIPKNANEGTDPDTVISRLTELFESSYPEAMAWCTDSMYLEEMPLFGSKHIDNYNKVDFGDVYVIDDDEKTKAIRVSSYNDYYAVRNAIMTGTAKISKLNSSPRNLNDPVIKFTVNEQVGWTKDAEGNVAAITSDITYNQWDIDSVKANLALAKEIQTPEDQAVVDLTVARAANYYPALYNSLNKVSDPMTVKALQKKIVQKMIQHDARAMSYPELKDAIIVVNGKEVKANSANVSAGHIMVGRFNTAALGIPTTVDPNTITSKETFKDALKQGGSWITIQTEEDEYNDSVYDLQAVAPNGHKMAIKVVKNTEELNELLNLKSPYTNELLIHRNGNYSDINGSLYYKEQEILTTGNLMPQMYSITDAQGVVHDMMIVVSEDPRALSTLSSAIDNAGWQSKRQNITEENKAAFGITASLNVARRAEANNYLSSIDRDAERKYESFKLTKKFIIARIPSQGMSSFQGAEVVLFTDNEHNEEYINQMKQCADGGDFDGDKSYGITYELINGFVETGTALQETGLLSLEECLQLPAVKDVIIDNEDPEAYELAITTDDALSFLAGNKLQVIKKLLTLPDNAKKIRITYDTNNDTAKTLANAIKTHFSTHLSVEANSAAIKNKALQKMLTITASPENYYNSTTSVDVLTKSFKDKANESELGKDKTRMSYDNPITCLKLQSINAVGRETIGITAVSMKAFFAASSYYNGIISELERETATLTSQPEITPKEREAFTQKLKSLIIDNPLRNGTETTCYANLNFNDLLYLLKQYPIDLSEEISLKYINPFTGEVITVTSSSAEEIVEQLSFISDLNDAVGEESAILTLSTDNAKEQALAALNAVPGMVDVYTALIALGNRFDDISKYMMSPSMNTVAQLMKQHILDGTGLKLTMSQAIKVLRGESIKKAKTFFYWYKDKYKDITTENFEDLTDKDFDILIKGIRKARNVDMEDMYSEDLFAEYFDPVDLFDFDDGSYNAPQIDFANEDDVPYQEMKALEALLKVYKEAYTQRLRMSKADLNNLEIIRTICDTTVETQQVLGGGAGINQGVKTQNYDKYAWRKRLETYYDKLFKNFGDTSVSDMNLEELIKNEDLRNKALHIAKDINKDSYDPITVLMTVPHYKAMLEAWATGEELTRTVSFRQRCVRILEQTLKPKNRTEYSKILNVLNDSIVANWLISANLQIGTKDYSYGERGKVSTISFVDVESLSNIAKLKEYMENTWLSELKKEMPGNAFLASIRRSVKEGDNGLVMYLKPDIPMNEIDDSEAYKRRYRAMCEDFRSLVNTTCPYIKMGGKEISWGDAFFLYNLIVNKEQAGPDSMTRLFETMILDPRFMKGEFVASSYYDYLQDLDRNGNAETFITNSTIVDCRDAVKPDNSSANRKNVHWTFALSNTMGGYKTLRSTTIIGSRDGTNMTLRDTLKYLTAEIAPEAYEHFHFYSDEVLDALSKREAVENDVAQVFTTEGTIDVDKVRQYKDAKAFIYNGEIYINKSKADITDTLHELMHMTLATMKWSENEDVRQMYYDILEEVKAYINNPKANAEVKQLKNKYAKKGFAGSDLLEEVFVSLCSMYAQNTYMVGDTVIENLDTILKVKKGANPLENLFKEIFANPRVNGDDSLSALVSKVSNLPLSTNIVENAAYQKLSSKVAALKENLVKTKGNLLTKLAYICQ